MEYQIKITTEKLQALAPMFGFKVHGDFVDKHGYQNWDLEFSNMFNAASFAQTINHEPSPFSNGSIDIKEGVSITSLYDTVVLTIVQF